MTTQYDKSHYVTIAQCHTATSIKKWLLTILFALMSIFVVMAGYSISASNSAITSSNNIENKIDTHSAKQSETEKNLIESIGELKVEIRNLNSEIKGLHTGLFDKLSKINEQVMINTSKWEARERTERK